jgi:hypothetical protein
MKILASVLCFVMAILIYVLILAESNFGPLYQDVMAHIVSFGF